MHRKFIAVITATAIAVTGLGAAPALADEDDVARTLAVILGLAVVGKIIHDKKKDDRAVTRQHSRHVYRAPQRHVKPHRQHGVRRHVNPRPLPNRVNRRLLPGQCLRSFRTYQSTYRGFGQRCLRNNYRFVNGLPRHCLYTFDTQRGQRNGYEARCLRDAGYRLARS